MTEKAAPERSDVVQNKHWLDCIMLTMTVIVLSVIEKVAYAISLSSVERHVLCTITIASIECRLYHTGFWVMVVGLLWC